MIDFAAIRAMTQQECVVAYFRGDEKLIDDLWWARHWKWMDSPGWKRLCVHHEAICLMAWEHTKPTLSDEQRDIFEAVRELNAFAKTIPHTNGQKQIYWLKREAIGWAVDQGLGNIRKVGTVVSCRTCDGSGRHSAFEWDDDEIIPCRRCGGGGAVLLQFHEIDIAGEYIFHQPDDSTTPFAGHQIDRLQTHFDPSLNVGRDGRKLDWELAGEMVQFLKRKFYVDQPHYVKDIYAFMNQFPVFGSFT
jgi:hypothetical protein